MPEGTLVRELSHQRCFRRSWFGIQRQDDLVDAVEAPLPLLDDPRCEGCRPSHGAVSAARPARSGSRAHRTNSSAAASSADGSCFSSSRSLVSRSSRHRFC